MGNYQWNLELLNSYLRFFGGDIIMAVAQGKGCEDFYNVNKRIPKNAGIKIIPYPNCPVIRETASLKMLLQEVIFKEGITLYAHSKGNTHSLQSPKKTAVDLWTRALHEKNINCPNLDILFNRFPVLGCFKKYGQFRHFPSDSTYHYTGSFFWFLNSSLRHRDWKNIVVSHHPNSLGLPPVGRYGTEAYISRLYDVQEAGVIFADGVGDLYSLEYLKQVLGREE